MWDGVGVWVYATGWRLNPSTHPAHAHTHTFMSEFWFPTLNYLFSRFLVNYPVHSHIVLLTNQCSADRQASRQFIFAGLFSTRKRTFSEKWYLKKKKTGFFLTRIAIKSMSRFWHFLWVEMKIHDFFIKSIPYL
jgi:hypothetical protein